MREKIIERIIKMLALAKDAGASAEERDTAMQMVDGLLTKYNLEVSDLEEPPEREAQEREGWSLNWSISVRTSIAKLFFSYYYRGRKINGTKCVHHFIGKKVNTLAAIELCDFVITSILQECRKQYGHPLSTKGRAFCVGASSQVISRSKELLRIKTTPPSEGGTSTALVLASLYESETKLNLALIEQAGVKLNSIKTRASVKDTEAFLNGKTFGDRINLNAKLGAKTQGNLK